MRLLRELLETRLKAAAEGDDEAHPAAISASGCCLHLQPNVHRGLLLALAFILPALRLRLSAVFVL